MSALSKILVKTVTTVIKNTTKLELSIDDLIGRFKEGCPPKDDLFKIIQQKNQLQSALENVVGAFTKIESTSNVTQSTITTIEAAVTIIKAIPIPTSLPPGIGIPLNVITILSDSLDKLSKVLSGAKGALSLVDSVSNTIVDASQTVINKLQSLENLLNVCIEDLAEGMTQADKNNLISQVGDAAASAGNFNNNELNIIDEQTLIERLSPTSNNPYLYQKTGFNTADWRLTLEHNQDNDFAFPQRRIKSTNINNDEENVYRGVAVYNTPDGSYSYSNSVKVLVEEAKFIIEGLNNKNLKI